jgi:lipopolysaccharide transport system permease protein
MIVRDNTSEVRVELPGAALATPSGGALLTEDDYNIDIQAGRGERHYLDDLWRFRELFIFLAWRDILVRYKQTVVGILWAILQPLLTMVVFTVVFGTLAQMPSGGEPYALLVFCGLLPWQFFARAVSEGSNSLIANASLVSKTYFPRLLIPTASVCTALVDFFISMGFLGLLLIWWQHIPTWRVLMLPLFFGIAFLPAMGAGVWLSALNAKYRDFRYIVPFLVQLGLFASPVGYQSSVIPEQWRLLYSLNPMTSAIDGFRWAVLGGGRNCISLVWPCHHSLPSELS